jgi:hypothetical protein
MEVLVEKEVVLPGRVALQPLGSSVERAAAVGPGSQIAMIPSARSCAISPNVRCSPEPVGYSTLKSSPKKRWLMANWRIAR